MNQALTIFSDATADELFAVVSDLQTYPHWLDLVSDVTADKPDAFLVTITAKLGPFVRSKKLRMVSSLNQNTKQATFTRQEVDGRDHSDWVMQATVEDIADLTADIETADSDRKQTTSAPTKKSKLSVSLHYDGSFWTGALEKILELHTASSTRKLHDYMEAQAGA